MGRRVSRSGHSSFASYPGTLGRTLSFSLFVRTAASASYQESTCLQAPAPGMVGLHRYQSFSTSGLRKDPGRPRVRAL